MTQEAIEQAIIDRLAPVRDGHSITVRALPKTPGEQGKLIGNGVVTVAWAADVPLNSKPGVGRKAQPVTRTIVLDGRLKALRDLGGMTQVQQQINRLLIGFKLPGAGVMRLRKFEFLERNEHYWRFEAYYQFPMMLKGQRQ